VCRLVGSPEAVRVELGDGVAFSGVRLLR
jgi:hypothetical protein